MTRTIYIAARDGDTIHYGHANVSEEMFEEIVEQLHDFAEVEE